MIKDKKETYYAPTRSAWRHWLSKNHRTRSGVWLIYDKKSAGIRTLSIDDITEEAICFGWIDSLTRSLSSAQAMLYISPRNPKSNWSRRSRELAKKMIATKKMTAEGLALIKVAKKSGTWTALEAVQNSVVPDDLKEAFKGQQEAWTNFSNFPPSSKRNILEWILNAKRPETRNARISETVKLAARNIRANHYKQ